MASSRLELILNQAGDVSRGAEYSRLNLDSNSLSSFNTSRLKLEIEDVGGLVGFGSECNDVDDRFILSLADVPLLIEFR